MLAKTVLAAPVEIQVGGRSVVNADITQARLPACTLKRLYTKDISLEAEIAVDDLERSCHQSHKSRLSTCAEQAHYQFRGCTSSLWCNKVLLYCNKAGLYCTNGAFAHQHDTATLPCLPETCEFSRPPCGHDL